MQFAGKSTADLQQLPNTKLIEICKHFKQPYSGQTFLAPLANKEKSAWKLGSLNEDNVRGVMSAVVKGVGGELEDLWESGLLRNKTNDWLATSLDGRARMKMKASDARVDDSSDDDGSCAWENKGDALDPQRLVSINCGLEIKTPSGAKVL